MRAGLITVPYNSAGRPDGVALAPAALRAAGLAADVDLGEVSLPPLPADRGPSGLVAEELLVAMVDGVAGRVRGAYAAGLTPLVVGGDCPVLLGGLLAARWEYGDVGLLFVDGHEDAWPPGLSLTGEAADCELGLALGRYPSPLGGRMPVVRPSAVVAIGPRDEADLASHGVPPLAPEVVVVRPGELRSVGIHVDGIRAVAPNWWLHVDLDVLSTDALSAVDYPQPGGLSWAELSSITDTALATPGCVGWTVTIYNPELDPDGEAACRIVRYVERALSLTGRGAT